MSDHSGYGCGMRACRSSMRGMIERLMSGVLAAYDELLADDSSAVNQVRSLQLLFDLKFLANVLTTNHDDSEVSLLTASSLLFTSISLRCHVLYISIACS